MISVIEKIAKKKNMKSIKIASPSSKKAFTLVELSVVLTILGILYMGAAPIVVDMIQAAKESALKENLRQLRGAIDGFYGDRNKYPENLEELVNYKYLRKVPVDPITGAGDWITIPYEPTDDELELGISMDGIYDIKSNAQGNSLGGESYSDW